MCKIKFESLIVIYLEKNDCFNTLWNLQFVTRLYSCQLNSQSCAYLASALINNSCLTELDLSKNALKYYGAQYLSEGLGNPSCKLSVLR